MVNGQMSPAGSFLFGCGDGSLIVSPAAGACRGAISAGPVQFRCGLRASSVYLRQNVARPPRATLPGIMLAPCAAACLPGACSDRAFARTLSHSDALHGSLLASASGCRTSHSRRGTRRPRPPSRPSRACGIRFGLPTAASKNTTLHDPRSSRLVLLGSACSTLRVRDPDGRRSVPARPRCLRDAVRKATGAASGVARWTEGAASGLRPPGSLASCTTREARSRRTNMRRTVGFTLSGEAEGSSERITGPFRVSEISQGTDAASALLVGDEVILVDDLKGLSRARGGGSLSSSAGLVLFI